jgi:hypothetical protein
MKHLYQVVRVRDDFCYHPMNYLTSRDVVIAFKNLESQVVHLRWIRDLILAQ